MFALWWAAPPGLEQYHPADLVHLRLQIDPLIKRGYSRNVDHSTDDDLTALAFRVAVHDRQRLDPSHIVYFLLAGRSTARIARGMPAEGGDSPVAVKPPV